MLVVVRVVFQLSTYDGFTEGEGYRVGRLATQCTVHKVARVTRQLSPRVCKPLTEKRLVVIPEIT